jgi:ClpP class serine protease
MHGHAFRNLFAAAVLLGVTATLAAGDTVEIRLKSGARWKGQLADHVRLTHTPQGGAGAEIEVKGKLVAVTEFYIKIETDVAGEIRTRTIFKGDINDIATLAGDPLAGMRRDAPGPAAKREGSEPASRAKPGVFVLPLGGMVGLEFRHDEMVKIAEEADKYGPGQIIILLIDSGGGMVTETETIHDTLMEIKKRHRLVAWIRKAISAACATASHCEEIYFMTEGTAGAMTAYAGTTAWSGEELQEWLRRAGDWMEEGGRSRYIAEAMIHAPKIVSYTRNPDTGEVTFFNDLSGEKVLSDEKTNLVFTASTAVDCGFADGIADTEEQLAKLLDLPEWHEISDYGRKLEREWKATVEQAGRDIPRLAARLEYKGTGSGDPVEVLATRIRIYEDLIRWVDRCRNCAMMNGVPPKDVLEREVKDMRKQLADMKKRR